MDRLSTIVVKPECREQMPPYLEHQISKRDDTSTSTATRAAHCGSLLEGLSLSYAQARWAQGFFTWFGLAEHNTLRPQEMFVLLCVSLFKAKLNLFYFGICSVLL
jgi:hypothetical protein